MKKILALVLACMMVLSLAACTTTTETAAMSEVAAAEATDVAEMATSLAMSLHDATAQGGVIGWNGHLPGTASACSRECVSGLR